MRRKPLMLNGELVADGDGVGDGEAASDAGVMASRITRMEAKTAPITFSNPPGRLCGRPLGLLLKMKILHLGGVARVRLCNRCKRRGTDGDAFLQVGAQL